MERTNRAALGRFVMRAKEYLAIVRVRDGALTLTTMLFADEVRPLKDVGAARQKSHKPTPKQLDAAVGQFGLTTLSASTRAIESGNASEDGTYTELENKLAALTNDRNALATQMINLLEGAEFGGTSISEQQANQLVEQGRQLLERAGELAQS